MSIEIVTAGPVLTIQDAGRNGFRRFGVSTAGPLDYPAMALANVLCGNSADAAAIEFAGFAGRFRANRAVRFCVTGGDCDTDIDGKKLPSGECYRLNPGEVLRVGALHNAVWGYLAFSGGIDVAPVLASRATHLRSGTGGLDGRTLQAGDNLPLGADTPGAPCLRPRMAVQQAAQDGLTSPIRLVYGPQDDYFSADILQRLIDEEFTVTPQRDRMAMALGGVQMPAIRGHDIVSDGTVPGSVQVPGSGQPLVLLAESQTTGGYPKIATVISADLHRLAQMATGSRIRFKAVSRDEAEELGIAHRRQLREKLTDLVAKPDDILSSEYLLSCDLVGGIFCPDEVVLAKD